MRTIAAVFLSKLGDLVVSQASLLLDAEVGEHRVNGESVGVIHGGGLRRERRGGRNEIWIRIEALAISIERLCCRLETWDRRCQTQNPRVEDKREK